MNNDDPLIGAPEGTPPAVAEQNTTPPIGTPTAPAAAPPPVASADPSPLVGEEEPSAPPVCPPQDAPLPEDLKPFMDAFKGDAAVGVEDTELTRGMAFAMKTAGLTPESAKKLTAEYGRLSLQYARKADAEETKDIAAQKHAMREEALKSMTKDDIGFANRALLDVCKDDAGRAFLATVRETVLGVHPVFLRLCALAGKSLKGDGVPSAAGAAAVSASSRPGDIFGD